MDNTPLDVRYLKGVGEKRANQLARLGLHTLWDLVTFYPRRYIDYSAPYSVAAAPYEEPCVVRAFVYSKGLPIRTGGGRTMVKVTAGDESAALTLTFFNNPYGVNALRLETEYLFYGKCTGPLTHREMVSPAFFEASGHLPLVPVYPLTEGISSKYLSACVKTALEKLQEAGIEDPLPASLRKEHGLMGLAEALSAIHFPKSAADAQEARTRLIFEELLLLQLGLLGLKGRSRGKTSVSCKKVDLAPFWRSLPFAPTGAQLRSAEEILKDMGGPLPMSRLLQGDVGSGKTLVAAAAMYAAAENGYQSALMAPTEILAVQHAETLTRLLSPKGISVALLTGGAKTAAKKATLGAISAGKANVVVGTHALLGEGVEFARLGLAVTDEQHRFGVRQRGALSQKGASPHLLVMSATPIPRTLGLIIFGDLDISVLDEMPAGRTPVKTYRVTTELRGRMFRFITRQVEQGRQAYLVCPVIEEGVSELQAVTTYYEKVAKPLLPGIRVGLLHGRMKAAEKARLMQDFKSGEIQVLCSTTVIEVGVDVPNATMMVVENAERFGLSALHQLRGRVGRGAAESFCILVSDHPSEAVRKRLAFLCHTGDGFEVARYDLETRGPGDFFGDRQHGLPQLKIADLASDSRLLSASQKEAARLFAEDPGLSLPEHAALLRAVQKLFGPENAGAFN